MRDRFPRITRFIISAPTNFIQRRLHLPIMGCENPHQFQQSVWESIPLLSKCIPARIKVWRCCLQGMDCFPLSQVDVGSFFKSAPVRRAGCRALLFLHRLRPAIAQMRASVRDCRHHLRCGIPLENTLNELSWKAGFFFKILLFSVGWPCELALGSMGGIGWELRRLY